MSVERLAEWATYVLELVGLAVVLFGALAITAGAVLHLLRERDRHGAYKRMRLGLGRAIILGLEFLVAADIVRTIAVDPTLRNIAFLGLIVVIRTFLSFSLEVELEGRWPWKAHEAEDVRGEV